MRYNRTKTIQDTGREAQLHQLRLREAFYLRHPELDSAPEPPKRPKLKIKQPKKGTRTKR